MNRVLLLLTSLGLFACASPGANNLDESGIYRFSDVPFQVEAPEACIADMSVHKEGNAVRFTTGRNNWRADGDYRMEVHSLPGVGDDEAQFQSLSQRAYRETMDSAGNRVLDSESTRVNDRPAFQGLASDESIAMVSGTYILFPDHIVMVQLLYPSIPGENDAEDLPWDCYQRFLDSITLTEH